ncbi:MAG: helix-turn-helix domain-containing protein [Clostridiales bacterium]|nr:helix-turn-helix domain-containing protein [Clostridiales bacterium]MCD7827297.1 helix-turn-helix domain-containing protein [Clostridiales bacterium]
MKKENIECGKRIRAVREFQHLSREKLAEKANISTQFLSDIETGKKGMTVVTLKKLCNALSVSSDSIIFGVDNDTEPELVSMILSVPSEKWEDFRQAINYIIKLLQ